MKKTFVAMLTATAIFFSQSVAFANTTIEKAKTLYDLGLLKGTGSSFSEDNLDLDRNATRAEACTTIVRMLGKEEKANYQQNPHPFNDVPQWASNNIGWLYENYLVNGVGDTYFGAQDIATVQQFSAMLLRVLGFSDSKWDFAYDNATQFASDYGLIPPNLTWQYELSRETMVIMCYNALKSNIKNSNRKLIKKLCDEGAVSTYVAESSGILKPPSLSDAFPGVEETLGNIRVYNRGNYYEIQFRNPAEEYGLRIFVLEDGGIMKEISLHGNDEYFTKGEISYFGGGKAGFLSSLYVYGLDMGKPYSFIVVKTSSEGSNYETYGKSSICHN